MEELFENPQAIILLVFMVIAALKFIGENLKGKKKEDETQPLADLYEDSREEILERQRSTSPPPPPLQKQPPPEQLSILDFLGPPVGSQPAEEVSSSPPPPLPRPVAVPPLPFTPKPKPSLSAAEKAALKRVEEGQAGITRPRRSIRRRPIRQLLSSPAAARDAIILGEILGPPRGQQRSSTLAPLDNR